jgi:hypothetical protein
MDEMTREQLVETLEAYNDLIEDDTLSIEQQLEAAIAGAKITRRLLERPTEH